MSATSPLAIMVYVILAMLLASTILRRFTKEKYIVALLRSSLQHRKHVIGSYKRTAKVYTIFIVVYCALIPVLLYLYFNREQGEWTLLVGAGVLVLMLIKAVEDIHYRNTVIARLEAKDAASHNMDTAPVSQERLETKVRKWRTIVLVIALICMVAILVAFYFTMGGPWWFYLIFLIVMVLAVALGSWLTYWHE
jgi:membrane protein YdbS with pleckstrin-like domain